MTRARARANLVSLLLICTGLTVSPLSGDATFDTLPLVAQALLMVAAFITGAAWTAIILIGIAYLIFKAFAK